MIAANWGRGALALFCLVAALAQWNGGTAWLPIWLANLGVKFGLDGAQSLRVLVGAELALGAMILLLKGVAGQRLAFSTAIAAAFVSLAELAALNTPQASTAATGAIFVWPALSLVVAMLLTVALSKSAAPTGHQSGVTVAMLSLVTATIAFSIAGRVPISNTVKTEAFSNQGLDAVDLAFESWKGRTFADAGVAKHVPQITAEVLEGDSIVVFYNPKCSHCHEVFNRWLSEPRSEKVIAVLVPAAEGATEAAGDGDIGDINCPNCVRLELPFGPNWLITTPAVAVVKDGIIRCTADKDFTACLGAPPSP